MSERWAGVHKEFNRDFCLDETVLRKIYEVFRKYAEKLPEKTLILFRVKKADDLYYDTPDIEDVLGDENSRDKKILKLRIWIERERPEEVPLFDHNEKYYAIVTYHLDNEDKIVFSTEGKDKDWCYLFADELESQIQRTFIKNRFRFLSYKTTEGVFVFSLVAILMSLLFRFYLPSPRISMDSIQKMTTEMRIYKLLELQAQLQPSINWMFPATFLILIGAMVTILLRPFSRLFSNLFRSVFYWGDMQAAHNKFRSRIRNFSWVILGGLIVTIVGGIIVALVRK